MFLTLVPTLAKFEVGCLFASFYGLGAKLGRLGRISDMLNIFEEV